VPSANVEEVCTTKRMGRWNKHVAKGKESIRFVFKQARLLTLLVRHPRAPWITKAIALCTVSYLLSPIQLIPTFVPVIGQLDDLFVLFVGMKLVRRFTPSEIFAECKERSEISTLRRRSPRQPDAGERSRPDTCDEGRVPSDAGSIAVMQSAQAIQS
jgi:uncharacterized membrane protein YkvA (DUF1232 family)